MEDFVMRYFVLFIFILFTLSGALVSKDYTQSKEKAYAQDKAPVLFENESSINYQERGILAAPPQLNSIVFDSARNGFGYSNSGPRSVDMAVDASSNVRVGVCYRGYESGDANSGIIKAANLNASQGFDLSNIDIDSYINTIPANGLGGRFPSFQAAPGGPVPIWNQYTVAGTPTVSDAMLSFDVLGWGAGFWIPQESWSKNSDPNIIHSLWLGCTDLYQDASNVWHMGGIWEIDLNAGDYTFIHGTSTNLQNWTWDAGIDPSTVGWTATDVEMNNPRFAWGSNGFGAWVSTGYFLGTGDDDFKLMLCTTNDYGATWSAVQRFEYSQLGWPEQITLADSLINPEDTLNYYVGDAYNGITYQFDLVVTPNNEIHVGMTHSWGIPSSTAGSYYPRGQHMGLFDVQSNDAGATWILNRIGYNSGLLDGDLGGEWETLNEIDLGYDDAGNFYAAWEDRDRQHAVLSAFPRFDDRNDENNMDVWASFSPDGGKTWSTDPIRVTNDTLTTKGGLRLAQDNISSLIANDTAKTYLVYQIGDPERIAISPPTTWADHVVWYYMSEVKLPVFNPGSIKPISDVIPGSFTLHQNYPNPFNPSTTIRFEITKSSKTELVVYNALGQQVAKLVNQQLSPAVYEYEWNASTMASGIYFYKLKTPEFTQVKKMVLMK